MCYAINMIGNRGYFGIGCVNMKGKANYGTLFRSANCFNADFIFLVGKRFKRQCSDTMHTERHIPLYEYQTCEDFLNNIPYNCRLVSAEITSNATDLVNFVHPERAIYVLGQEDGNVPQAILEKSIVVKIPTWHCLNVSVAGSIILYDRIAKSSCKT